MANLLPVLIGTAGLVDGEIYRLDVGVDVVVGRSRSCDISLRRTAAYLQTPPLARDSDHDFNTVSRRHVRIQVNAQSASLQDLSTNGTFVDGEPLRETRLITLTSEGTTVRLGTRETFQLLLLPDDDPRVKDLEPVSVLAAAARAEGDPLEE
jgi:pSer/pThr/pTyr-binding forkhead associated (FHA) protein